MSESPANYTPGAVVKYSPATDTKGSRWTATIKRGNNRADITRASVPYADGPDAAAAAVVARFNATHELRTPWQITGPALSLDGGNLYAFPIG